VLSSRALEEGVAIHKKASKRVDCDVANAPRNDDCGWANYLYQIALVMVSTTYESHLTNEWINGTTMKRILN
jgi:hypothetical protein